MSAARVAGAQTTASGEAPAAPPAPRPPAAATAHPGVRVDFTLMNAYDGNLNREPVALRSYALAPGVSVHYEPAGAFGWAYDGALNEYTGTDRWDRLSHTVSGVMTRHRGLMRAETLAVGSWKVPTDDREITKQVELAERLTLALTDATRLQLVGAYRYKYYVEHVETSGNSPYAGARIEHRYGTRHVAFAYRFQTRESRAIRDRFKRHGYAASFSTPLSRADDLSLEFEFRPQTYGGLVPAGNALVHRHDRRILTSATYQRPVTARVNLLGLAGFQRRWSNEPIRRYVEPTLTLSLRYHWR